MQEISSFEIYLANLIFDISDNTRANPTTRVRISNDLLNQIKEEMDKKTDYSFKITNKTLITYALLNLLDDNLKDQIRYQLDANHIQPALSKLLSIQQDPRQKQQNLNKEQLMNIRQSEQDNQVLLHSVISGISWLLLDRMGLNKKGFAKNSDDAYEKLRDNDTKQLIDELLRAGVNETDRQRHIKTIDQPERADEDEA